MLKELKESTSPQKGGRRMSGGEFKDYYKSFIKDIHLFQPDEDWRCDVSGDYAPKNWDEVSKNLDKTLLIPYRAKTYDKPGYELVDIRADGFCGYYSYLFSFLLVVNST